jgi:hypothetical protein
VWQKTLAAKGCELKIKHMKKTILCFLLVAGIGSDLLAQRNYSYYSDFSNTQADWIFNSPKPGKLNSNFHFWNVPGNIRFSLELSSIKQLNHLPNLDSILLIVKNDLKILADSLKQDGINRRVDVVVSDVANRKPQFRITNYDARPKAYTIQNGDLVVLKVDNDTLRIKFFVPNNGEYYVNESDVRVYTKKPFYPPVFMTIYLANISNIYNLGDTTFQACINRLRKDVNGEYVNKAASHASYSASYNMVSKTMFSPSSKKWIKYGRYRNELVPNIYGSLQFSRGSFAPSMAAGLRFSTFNRINTNRFFLMWEPYFFFNRDVANKLNTDRNDFITFRYYQVEEKRKGGFEMVTNFSVGYLAGRRGNWFEQNTFKLGLPGVRSGWLQLEPEFYFNDAFKNFSPTLKLTLHYE